MGLLACSKSLDASDFETRCDLSCKIRANAAAALSVVDHPTSVFGNEHLEQCYVQCLYCPSQNQATVEC